MTTRSAKKMMELKQAARDTGITPDFKEMPTERDDEIAKACISAEERVRLVCEWTEKNYHTKEGTVSGPAKNIKRAIVLPSTL